ncbi:MAG: DUF1566 domain-containing protein, partial [Bacteroidales bacterium]|nr:DUF1566 domain-containing protein [Bacteroidales bacterium]
IQANNLYGMENGIEVTLTKPLPYLPCEFSVSVNTKVKFSKGNLWYDGSAFHFETNQWGTQPASNGQWVSDHVSHFKWSDVADAVTGNTTYAGTSLFCASNFTVDGEDAGTWRTLSSAEWVYLINTDGKSGRTDANRFAKAKVSNVQGLLIFPDGYSGTTTGDGIAAVNSTNAAYPGDNIPDDTWASMEAVGVVFLPAAGYRNGTGVNNVGSNGRYWSSTPNDTDYAYYLNFGSGGVTPQSSGYRGYGYSVRLVR